MFDIFEDEIIDNTGKLLNLDELKQQLFDIESVIASSEDDIFPDFLFSPMSNDFDGEDYISKGLVFDELSQKVKQLRRKYGNFNKYLDALAIYEEYKDTLKAKYGSMKFAKSGIKSGLFPEMYVVKPKIKMGKVNKQLLAIGEVVSDIDNELESNFDGAFLENSNLEDSVLHDDDFYDMNKIHKVFNQEFEEQKRRARRRELTLRYRGTAEVDDIVKFINNGGYQNYNEYGQPITDDDKSLVELAMEEDFDQYRNQDIKEIEERESEVRIEFGRVMKNSSDHMIVEMMTELYRNGFDISGKGKHIGSSGKKLLRANLNKYGLDTSVTLTKKQKRKMKKKQKKHRKLLEKEMRGDSKLTEILNNNRISFKLGDQIGGDWD